MYHLICESVTWESPAQSNLSVSYEPLANHMVHSQGIHYARQGKARQKSFISSVCTRKILLSWSVENPVCPGLEMSTCICVSTKRRHLILLLMLRDRDAPSMKPVTNEWPSLIGYTIERLVSLALFWSNKQIWAKVFWTKCMCVNFIIKYKI